MISATRYFLRVIFASFTFDQTQNGRFYNKPAFSVLLNFPRFIYINEMSDFINLMYLVIILCISCVFNAEECVNECVNTHSSCQNKASLLRFLLFGRVSHAAISQFHSHSIQQMLLKLRGEKTPARIKVRMGLYNAGN